MEWLVIYLLVMVERVGALLSFGWGMFWGGALIMGVSILSCVLFADSYRGEELGHYTAQPWAKKSRSVAKWMMICGAILGSISQLMPSQKEVAIIAGAGMTYKAVTSETGQRIGGKAISLLEQRIEDALKDTPEPVKTVAPVDPVKK